LDFGLIPAEQPCGRATDAHTRVRAVNEPSRPRTIPTVCARGRLRRAPCSRFSDVLSSPASPLPARRTSTRAPARTRRSAGISRSPASAIQGGLSLDPSPPVTDAHLRSSAALLAYARVLDRGVWARTGNDFDLIAVAWQYRWGGGVSVRQAPRLGG